MNRGVYSDPVENLLSYVMVHRGIDQMERLLDVEWVRDVVAAARKVAAAHDEQELDSAILTLRALTRGRPGVGAT